MSRSIYAPRRLTPDFTVRGMCPTKAEYDLHIALLLDIDAKRCMWRFRDMSAIEHDVWCAVHQCGILRDGVLTEYGMEYLQQRAPRRDTNGNCTICGTLMTHVRGCTNEL